MGSLICHSPSHPVRDREVDACPSNRSMSRHQLFASGAVVAISLRPVKQTKSANRLDGNELVSSSEALENNLFDVPHTERDVHLDDFFHG